MRRLNKALRVVRRGGLAIVMLVLLLAVNVKAVVRFAMTPGVPFDA